MSLQPKSNVNDQILNKYQCELYKGFYTHHCLVRSIEKWKESVGNGIAFVALKTNVSKAFNCLYKELLIAKL